MRTTKRLLIAVAATVLAAGIAQAASVTWNIGNGTWDTSTTSNWAPAQVPVGGDNVFLTRNDAGGITIDYAATLASDLNTLTVSNASATTSLVVGTGDTLRSKSMTLNAGGRIAMSDGMFNLTTGFGSSTITGATFDLSGGTVNMSTHLTISGNGTVNQTGGSILCGNTPDIYLYNGTYTISNGLCDPRGLFIQGSSGATATFNVNGGTVSPNPGNEGLHLGGTAGTSVLNQSAGQVEANGPYFYVDSNGTYNMNGGTVLAGQLSVRNGGVINRQAAMTFNAGYELNVADTAGTGTFNMSGGSMSARGVLVGASNSGQGIFNQTGGTFAVGQTNATISTATATVPSIYTLQGGTLTNQAGWSPTLTIHPLGTMQGYGTMSLPNAFTMNGKVIADGYGSDNTLSMLNYSSLTNSVNNTTDKGWYVRNHGKLSLKGISIAATGTPYYWGESGSLDLINAFQINASSRTGNPVLTASLLARDYSAYTSLVGSAFLASRALSVYDLGLSGGTMTADLTFRIDLTDLATLGYFPIELYHYNSGTSAWEQLGQVTPNSTVSFYGISNYSMFALVVMPEPGTALLLCVPAIGILRRSRRIS